jgi:hypothetical protein
MAATSAGTGAGGSRRKRRHGLPTSPLFNFAELKTLIED